MTERHLRRDPPTPGEIAAATADVDAAIAVAEAEVGLSGMRTLVGLAGTRHDGDGTRPRAARHTIPCGSTWRKLTAGEIAESTTALLADTAHRAVRDAASCTRAGSTSSGRAPLSGNGSCAE